MKTKKTVAVGLILMLIFISIPIFFLIPEKETEIIFWKDIIHRYSISPCKSLEVDFNDLLMPSNLNEQQPDMVSVGGGKIGYYVPWQTNNFSYTLNAETLQSYNPRRYPPFTGFLKGQTYQLTVTVPESDTSNSRIIIWDGEIKVKDSLINEILEWCQGNWEWIFYGLGVFLIIVIWGVILDWRRKKQQVVGIQKISPPQNKDKK